MDSIDITPHAAGVIAWAKKGLRESASDSHDAEVFRNILREYDVDPEGW